MQGSEVIGLVVTFLGVFSFAVVFTILFRGYSNVMIKETISGKRDIELIDEEIKKKKFAKRNRIIKIVKNVVFYLILIIMIPLFIISLVNKIQGNVSMLGKNIVMVVASDSMSVKNEANDYLINYDNQFNTYDIIFLERINEDDLKKYDVIAFKNGNVNIIHRIVDIEETSLHDIYTTRGDKYDEDDQYKPSYEEVIGVYRGKRLKGIGIFIRFAQSYAGIITVLSLIYCMIMIDYYSKKMDKSQNERLLKLSEILGYIDSNLETKFVETIYYKGYEYTFDEKGFIDKKEILDERVIDESMERIIRLEKREDEEDE